MYVHVATCNYAHKLAPTPAASCRGSSDMEAINGRRCNVRMSTLLGRVRTKKVHERKPDAAALLFRA